MTSSTDADATGERATLRRFVRVVAAETAPLNARLWVALAFARLAPPLRGDRMRRVLLRAAGVEIGRGTLFGGSIRMEGSPRPHENVTIGSNCWINSGCFIDTSARVVIGDGVSLAQDVMLLTGTHRIGPPHFRAGPSENLPVTVGDGAWLGARVLVLPGVTIGAGSVVAAGAVVVSDVPPNVLVGGVPARILRQPISEADGDAGEPPSRRDESYRGS